MKGALLAFLALVPVCNHSSPNSTTDPNEKAPKPIMFPNDILLPGNIFPPSNILPNEVPPGSTRVSNEILFDDILLDEVYLCSTIIFNQVPSGLTALSNNEIPSPAQPLSSTAHLPWQYGFQPQAATRWWFCQRRCTSVH